MPAPFGYVYDVQAKEQGKAWNSLAAGVSTDSADFTPSAGQGTYQFRAWLRKQGTRFHSSWSPPSTITITP